MTASEDDGDEQSSISKEPEQAFACSQDVEEIFPDFADDPFSPDNPRMGSLDSIRNRSLTIYNLSTPCSPLVPNNSNLQDCPWTVSQDEKDRRYDLAYAITEYAHLSRGEFDEKRPIFHLALVEYYKLIRLDFYYTGALEAVLLLLSILKYDKYCLSLMDFVLTWLEEHRNERIQGTRNSNDKEEEDTLMEWVYGDRFPQDHHMHRFEDRLEVLTGQQWCPNAFLVPLFLITLRRMDHFILGGKEDQDRLERAARLGAMVEELCCDESNNRNRNSKLPVLRGLLHESKQKWGEEKARILLAHPSTRPGLGEPDRWGTSCLLFWNILREYIEDDVDHCIEIALEYIIDYMDRVLEQPAALEDEPQRATCWMDLFSAEHCRMGNLYCIHCRQRLSSPGGIKGETTLEGPRAMRCSRCCVVHYCSRKCQKANYPLHKERCKNIHTLRSSLPSTESEAKQSNDDEIKARRYNLAYAIVDLAYLSTDTIDRGRRIYHLALVEYYKLLQIDFHHVGALESVLILLSILGHDNHLLGLMDFVFYWLEHCPKEIITVRNKSSGKDDDRFLDWTQGGKLHERKQLWTDLGKVSLLEGKQWCANNFLVPLFMYSLKHQSSQRKECDVSASRKISANIGKMVEGCNQGMLPVLRALLPDSIQRWSRDEAAELLALARMTDSSNCASLPETGHWEESCILFWDIIKDAFALTPKVAEALQDTIDAMEEDSKGYSAVLETPQDLGGLVG